jgi:phage-related protein
VTKAKAIKRGLALYNKNAMIAAWKITFYSPRVAAQLERWPDGILASCVRIVRMMQSQGPDIGMPHTRAIGAGLFEIRAKGREGIGRAFYCTVAGDRIIILHVLIKKTEQTPARDLETARARQREVRP